MERPIPKSKERVDLSASKAMLQLAWYGKRVGERLPPGTMSETIAMMVIVWRTMRAAAVFLIAGEDCLRRKTARVSPIIIKAKVVR